MTASFEQMQQFIELRAENVSYAKSAKQIGVSQTTLMELLEEINENIEMSSGAAEASLLEPFDSISDWLLSRPDIDWMLQLREASRNSFVQQYQL